MNISFVVCCHNSAARLPVTLTHLAAIDSVPGLDCEVVVVDNASSDNTAAIARQQWVATGDRISLRVVKEPRPGLVHARRSGVAAARHEIVCFVDDDNWIGPNWPCVLREIFMSRPEVGAVGGRGRPVFQGPEPDWFSAVQWAYAVGPQAPESGIVPVQRNYLYGAGLAVRRQAFLDLVAKGFRPLLTGRQGTTLLAGEDSELCFALGLAGWRLWYDARLTFDHFIPAARLQRSYAVGLIEQLGYATAWLDAYVIAGAATRPRRWLLLNRHFLPRLMTAGLKYIGAALSSRVSKSGDMRRQLQKGRFRGILAGRQIHASMRRQLGDFCRPKGTPAARI